MLRTQDGERRLTDLRHVAQLLHEAAMAEHAGVTALTAWLRRQIADAADDTTDEERSRRLESDAEAVQVLTIHRSKGLEFPIVMFPYLWEPGYIPRDPQPIFFHDPSRGDERVVDVGMGGVDFADHRRQHEAEQRGEDLRLAYVALTRAQHQAVVWWAGSWDSRNSALGRLVFSRGPDGTVPPKGSSTPSDAAATARFEELAAQAPGCISVEHAAPAAQATWEDPQPPAPELVAARFDRVLDWGWRRTSYSDITAGAHEARVTSEPEEHLVTDEGDAAGPPPVVEDGADADALRAVPSLLADMPFGAHVGTFVHGVFEATDFAAPDLEAELGRRIDEVQARRAVDVGDRGVVLAGLGAVIETPLGPLLGGARLRDVARADRLDELDFELPLAGGDLPSGRVDLAAIGAVLRDDPELASYAERLDDPALRSRFRGYLTGSVDLVVRRGDRFAVVDYKTNWLGAPGEELSAWHHRPARAGGGDAPVALRAAGAALHRRAAPLPALADAGLRPRAQPRGRAVPVPARHGRAGHAGDRRHAVRGVLVAAVGRARDPAERRAGRPRMSLAETDPFAADIALRAPALLRAFNDAGVLSAADVHVAQRLARLAGEEDPEVALAAALAVRGPRMGHVHVDLATARDTAAVDEDEDIDVSALPWPEPGDWVARVGAQPARGGRRGRPGEPSAAARRRGAVPRPLLARGARRRC